MSVLFIIDIVGFVLVIGSFLAMRRFHVGMIPVIGISTALGAAWGMLT